MVPRLLLVYHPCYVKVHIQSQPNTFPEEICRAHTLLDSDCSTGLSFLISGARKLQGDREVPYEQMGFILMIDVFCLPSWQMIVFIVVYVIISCLFTPFLH